MAETASSSTHYSDNVSAFPRQGGCSCGRVRYRLERAPIVVHCCHCTLCQRETGSAFAINALVEADSVTGLPSAPPSAPHIPVVRMTSPFAVPSWNLPTVTWSVGRSRQAHLGQALMQHQHPRKRSSLSSLPCLPSLASARMWHVAGSVAPWYGAATPAPDHC